MFNILGSPAEPMTEEERQPTPLSPAPRGVAYITKLFQVICRFFQGVKIKFYFYIGLL